MNPWRTCETCGNQYLEYEPTIFVVRKSSKGKICYIDCIIPGSSGVDSQKNYIKKVMHLFDGQNYPGYSSLRWSELGKKHSRRILDLNVFGHEAFVMSIDKHLKNGIPMYIDGRNILILEFKQTSCRR